MNRFRYVLFVACLLLAGQTRLLAQTNLEMLSQVSASDLGTNEGSDVWGWTDPLTGREYALAAMTDRTSFVDVTDPFSPVIVGHLPSRTGSIIFRDVKVYDNHAYIVSDLNGPHGMQVFDLTNLRGVTSPTVFSATSNYDGIRSAHNIAINEESGFAYLVGSNESGGGLHILDLSNPAAPQFAGEFASDGYTHDAQIVTYEGPDANFQGREIVFASNLDTVTIVDVTDKQNPSLISRTSYPSASTTHQGWLSEDGNYFYFNDETDGRWTHILDVSDLAQPQYIGNQPQISNGEDHNLYAKGKYIYASTFFNGLRVLEQTDPANNVLTEVASSANGLFLWSVYPFFESGTIIGNGGPAGLTIARLDLFDGDFNHDGELDCTDVDELTAAIAAGSVDLEFDLTGDNQVSSADLDAWLMEAGAENLDAGNAYLPGDANLDGAVNGEDFLVWNAHKFSPTGAWCQGDFNADGETNGEDFLVWNANKFQTADAIAVPEPTTCGLLLIAALVCLRAR